MEWLKWVHGERPTATGDYGPGDEIRVWYRILEQGKERLGQFEGIVLRCRGAGPSKTFTVRRITYGEGVERVFPMDAKVVSRIEVLRKGKVRRSRLYFLRSLVGKSRISSEEAESAGTKSAEVVPVVDKTADTEEAAQKS